MYTLYYLPGACALATQVVLRELNQTFELIDKRTVKDFQSLNPTATIPVLVDGQQLLVEGAAIMLYLLDKHENTLLPANAPRARQQAIENIMFANATMHPAYNRLFFAADKFNTEKERQQYWEHSARAINELWQVVALKLQSQPYLGGEQISAADILLAVYAQWGNYFPVDIVIPDSVNKMISSVSELASFKLSVAAELENAQS